MGLFNSAEKSAARAEARAARQNEIHAMTKQWDDAAAQRKEESVQRYFSMSPAALARLAVEQLIEADGLRAQDRLMGGRTYDRAGTLATFAVMAQTMEAAGNWPPQDENPAEA